MSFSKVHLVRVERTAHASQSGFKLVIMLALGESVRSQRGGTGASTPLTNDLRAPTWPSQSANSSLHCVRREGFIKEMSKPRNKHQNQKHDAVSSGPQATSESPRAPSKMCLSADKRRDFRGRQPGFPSPQCLDGTQKQNPEERAYLALPIRKRLSPDRSVMALSSFLLYVASSARQYFLALVWASSVVSSLTQGFGHVRVPEGRTG